MNRKRDKKVHLYSACYVLGGLMTNAFLQNPIVASFTPPPQIFPSRNLLTHQPISLWAQSTNESKPRTVSAGPVNPIQPAWILSNLSPSCTVRPVSVGRSLFCFRPGFSIPLMSPVKTNFLPKPHAVSITWVALTSHHTINRLTLYICLDALIYIQT